MNRTLIVGEKKKMTIINKEIGKMIHQERSREKLLGKPRVKESLTKVGARDS